MLPCVYIHAPFDGLWGLPIRVHAVIERASIPTLNNDLDQLIDDDKRRRAALIF